MVTVALVDQCSGRRHQGAHAPGRDFDAEAGGHHLFELVRLVEHDDVVLGEHDPPAGQVGPIEVGVHHDDVGRGRPVAGCLGETLASRRAVEGAGTLARPDAHHVPGPIGGLEAQVGPVPGLRRLGPGHQAPHLVDQSDGGRTVVADRSATAPFRVLAAGPLITELGLHPVGAHLEHPLPAQVVAAALEHGVVERCRQAQAGLEQRQVLAG